MVFFVFCFRFTELLRTLVWCFYQIGSIFGYYFSKSFLLILFLLFLWDPNCMYIRSLDIVLEVLDPMVIFIKSFFSLLQVDQFLLTYFQVYWPFLCSALAAIMQTQCIFISDIVFFSVNIFLLSFSFLISLGIRQPYSCFPLYFNIFIIYPLF